MTVPISDGPLPSVEGLCLVHENGIAKLFYRKADGTLEDAPACEFVSSGQTTNHIYINRWTLANGSMFRPDPNTGSILVHI